MILKTCNYQKLIFVNFKNGVIHMPKKSKEARIRELEEQLENYKEYLDKTTARNRELVDAEEGTFLHSPTYLQMQEEIKFLQNLQKLNDHHLASAKAQIRKADDAYRQTYNDNKRLTDEKADTEYFIGLTENWRSAQEYQKLKNDNAVLQGKIEQKDISIANRDAEIERLRHELAVIKLQHGAGQPVAAAPHNVRGAGRKKLDANMQQKIESFRSLQEQGCTKMQIMEQMNISQMTYYRYQKLIFDKNGNKHE